MFKKGFYRSLNYFSGIHELNELNIDALPIITMRKLVDTNRIQ